jgi:hypothetical protein
LWASGCLSFDRFNDISAWTGCAVAAPQRVCRARCSSVRALSRTAFPGRFGWCELDGIVTSSFGDPVEQDGGRQGAVVGDEQREAASGDRPAGGGGVVEGHGLLRE